MSSNVEQVSAERSALILRVQDEIVAGIYETEKRIDRAVEGVAEDLESMMQPPAWAD